MNVIVFGSTGGTGLAIVRSALERGHHVTAFARRPDAVGITHENLRVVAGDALDATSVATAIDGHDAVINSLGSRPWRSDRVCSRGTDHILAAMTASGPRRLVCISSVGVGTSRGRGPMLVRFAAATMLRGVLADKEVMEAHVRATALDWVLVQPVGLTDGSRRGEPRVAVDGVAPGSFIARADVADFAVEQLTSDTYLGQSPCIASRN